MHYFYFFSLLYIYMPNVCYVRLNIKTWNHLYVKVGLNINNWNHLCSRGKPLNVIFTSDNHVTFYIKEIKLCSEINHKSKQNKLGTVLQDCFYMLNLDSKRSEPKLTFFHHYKFYGI